MIGEIFERSFQTFKSQFKFFIPFLLIFLIIGNISNMALLTGAKAGSGTYILYQLLEGLLLIWLEVTIMLGIYAGVQKKGWTFGEALKEGLFNTPAYLLYSFLFALMMMIGLVLFIIPGLYVIVVFSLGPIVAIFDPDCSEGYFSESKRLVQENYLLIILLILLEGLIIGAVQGLPVLGAKLIQTEGIDAYIGMLLSFPEALFAFWLACLSVQAYLVLKNSAYYREEE